MLSSFIGAADKKNKKCLQGPVFDFIIIGSGPGGCTLAEILTQSGEATVLLLEAGLDDARIPQSLPRASTANVPQPYDPNNIMTTLSGAPNAFDWGKYIRSVTVRSIQESRGFANYWFFVKQSADPNSRSISYPRAATVGGCTSHNLGTAVRPLPEDWNNWGLEEWQYSKVSPYYKQVENRSQLNGAKVPYYNPSVVYPPPGSNDPNHPENPNANPSNTLGGFSKQYYGYNGFVPLLWSSYADPSAILNSVNDVVVNVLNNASNPNNNSAQFNYPLNVDLDYPPTAFMGGTSLQNQTSNDQTGYIAETGAKTVEPFAQYNYPRYGDAGFVYPPELANFGFVGLAPVQRVNANYAYLYPIQKQRKNLTVKTGLLATKILLQKTCKKHEKNGKCTRNGGKFEASHKAVGIQYLEGFNIYKAGRNLSMERAGDGGSIGDAIANSIISKSKGYKYAFARKEVICCAGFINTTQLLQLSGIGDAVDLRNANVKQKIQLPVGKSLIDNQELFMYFRNTAGNPIANVFLAAKQKPSDMSTSFDIGINGFDTQSLECEDPTIQYNFIGTKNLSGFDNQFVRNGPNNILIDPEVAGNPYPPIVSDSSRYLPIYQNFNFATKMIVEQQQNNLSRGFVRIRSNDPTEPPQIVFNYFSDPQDQQAWINIFMNNIFPMLLGLGSTTPATATATIKLSSIQVISAGSGYTNASVNITDLGGTGSGAAATANIANGKIVSYTITNPGSNYTGPFKITINGNAGSSGAIAEGLGSIDQVTLTSPGSGFSTAAQVNFLKQPQAAVPSENASATAIMSSAASLKNSTGYVVSISLNDAGNGYSQAPNVLVGSFFEELLDPAPYDILKDGNIRFTSLSQVDINKLKRYLSQRIGGHHGGGTCPMGRLGDPNAVCDPHGRVFHVDGLRVVDNSLIKTSFRWPNGYIYVMASLIGDNIREVWNI